MLKGKEEVMQRRIDALEEKMKEQEKAMKDMGIELIRIDQRIESHRHKRGIFD